MDSLIDTARRTVSRIWVWMVVKGDMADFVLGWGVLGSWLGGEEQEAACRLAPEKK